MPYKMNLDLFCIMDHESVMFSKDLVHEFKSETDFEQIQPIFMNPTNPHKSAQIFST
jgi:hypothetical protein